MSHFSRIRTRIVEKEYLLQALRDLGYACEEGNVEVRGYGGNRTQAHIKIHTSNPAFDIGFLKTQETYDIVADWWGIRDIDQEQFQQNLTRRYAYNAARAQLEAQGFSLAHEEVQEDGRIHLVLRRVV